MPTNVFETTNSVTKATTKIQFLEPGRVFFFHNQPFVRLAKPVGSDFTPCSNCHQAGFNAHNFACAVHFCFNKDYEVEISDFVVKPDNT